MASKMLRRDNRLDYSNIEDGLVRTRLPGEAVLSILTRSYWIPGSVEMSSSMSAPSNALPRFRTL